MKKFLSFILVLGLGVSFSDVFAQGEAQSQKNIYLYNGTVELPNGQRYEAKFVIDEFGKMKVKLFDSQGREYKTYDTRVNLQDKEGNDVLMGEFDPASLSTVFDIKNEYGFGFVKKKNQWKAVVFRLVENKEGLLGPELHTEVQLRDERRVNLTKFSGRDSKGRVVEAYFNPCDRQFVLTREGQNLLEDSYIIGGHRFHKTVPQDRTRPNVYTYMMSWRKDNADVNGMFRVGMDWDSTQANRMTVLLPKVDGSALNPLDPRGAENRDGIVLTAEGAVNFLDCLNQKYPDGQDRVSTGRTERSEQSSCSDKNVQERLRQMVDEIGERESFLFARDLDDVVE